MLNALIYIPIAVGVAVFWFRVGTWAIANYRRIARDASTVKARLQRAKEAMLKD